jgi:hypothetical protein
VGETIHVAKLETMVDIDRVCTIKHVMVVQRSKTALPRKGQKHFKYTKEDVFYTIVEPSTLNRYNVTSVVYFKNVIESGILPWDASIRIETVASGGKILKLG